MPSQETIHAADSTITQPNSPVIRAENLTKSIGGRTIVEDVSFDVNEGEILGFLGPNGAGKTTTIRMLVGLIRPDSGSVRIAGKELRSSFEHAMRQVGCIVEQPDLYRFLTGRENLLHFARMLQLPPAAIEEPAELARLSHRLDDPVRTYSLGMRQRLGIAQALLGEPRALILDEPANGLDPAGIREMRDLLRMLARERRLGVLVSSHLLGEVEQICDSVVIIQRGRVIATGPVDELIAGESLWQLEAAPIELAMEVVRKVKLDPYVVDGVVVFRCDTPAIPELVRALVKAGVGVTRIAPRRATLEEMFIDATHGESV